MQRYKKIWILANDFVKIFIIFAVLGKKTHEFKPKFAFLTTFWLKLNASLSQSWHF